MASPFWRFDSESKALAEAAPMPASFYRRKITMFNKVKTSVHGAMEQLRDYQDRTSSPLLNGLIDCLQGCDSSRPCNSGVCPECTNDRRRWTVEEGEVLEATWNDWGCDSFCMTLSPDFGRVSADRLNHFDISLFRKRTRETLLEAPVDDYLLTIGVRHERCFLERDSGAYQFILSGICKAPPEGWRARLKECVNPSGTVPYPLVVHKKRSLNTAIDHGMNSILRIARHPYQGRSSVDLLLFLHSVPLRNRVLIPSDFDPARRSPA
jgi:hypothetical protein